MNGRIYDPELGRFIQADPMVEPDATQGLNRYSYVLNNPLSGTDPSGYLTFRQVVGIAIAVVAAAYGQYYFAEGALQLSFGIAVAGGFTASYVATGSVEAGLWGAFAAGVFWGVGTAFSTGYCDLSRAGAGATATTGSVTARVAAHAAAGGTLNLMQGGKFGHGFASAGITQALSPVIGRAGGNGPKGIVTRAALSAALGGTVSKITGGKFANGAATSAFASLFAAKITSAAENEGGVALAGDGMADESKFHLLRRYSVGRLDSNAGEGRVSFLKRVGKYLRAYADETNFEACGDICEAPSGALRVDVVSVRSHVGCGTSGACSSGFSATGETIHGHGTDRGFRVNKIDAVVNSDLREGSRVREPLNKSAAMCFHCIEPDSPD